MYKVSENKFFCDGFFFYKLIKVGNVYITLLTMLLILLLRKA